MADEKKEESKEPILIQNLNLLQGFYASLHNAENFLTSSKTLFDKDDFQSCIPLAIISIEESLKGIELLRRFQRGEYLTNEVLTTLKNHKHKLTHVMNESLEILKNIIKDLEKTKETLGKSNIGIGKSDLSQRIANIQSRSAVYSHFQELKEACFYADWDKPREKWMLFDELLKDSKEKLAFFVHSEAEILLNLLKIGIETYVNRLRETGQLLEKLPYPSYPEHRSPENFESNTLKKPLGKKIDQIKHNEGLKIMKQFIKQRSFEFLSFDIFSNTKREYLKVIEKQSPDKWYPHPVIKAMMITASKAQKLDKEKDTVTAISDDSDVTYEGKPMMIFNVTAKVTSDV